MKKTLKITLLALLFIAIATTGIYFTVEQQGYAIPLSIDNIDVEGNNQIRISAVAGRGAEELVINWGENYLTNFLKNDGYQATESLNGRITIDNLEKSFFIDKQEDENFLNFKLKDLGRFNLCKDSNCISDKPIGYIYDNGDKTRTTSGKCVCFYYKNVGTNGEFSGREVDNTEVNIKIGDHQGILKPSSGETILRFDSNNYVEWTGNLNNYEQVFSPNYDVLFVGSQFNKLISDNAYSNHENAIQEIKSKFTHLFTLDYYNSMVDTFNNKVNTALTSKTASYKQSVNANSVTFNRDSMDVSLETPSVLPTIVFTLDADSVGINKLEGEPKIIKCAEDETIWSGDRENTYVAVQNIGDEDGSFTGKLTCTGGDVIGRITETTINQGKVAKLPISFSGEKATKGIDSVTCKIVVEDVASGESDSCTFKVNVKYQKGLVCEPESKKCVDDKTVRICSKDGSSYQDIECDIGCEVLANGDGRCQGQVTPNTEETNWTPLIIIGAIVLVALLFMGGDKKKEKVNNNG